MNICLLSKRFVDCEFGYLTQLAQLRNDNKMLQESLDEILIVQISRLKEFAIDIQIERINDILFLYNYTIY